MKLPLKYIAILVIASLTGIFVYQAYWLTDLYHTMYGQMERSISEAMRISDYNEMMVRVNKLKTTPSRKGQSAYQQATRMTSLMSAAMQT